VLIRGNLRIMIHEQTEIGVILSVRAVLQVLMCTTRTALMSEYTDNEQRWNRKLAFLTLPEIRPNCSQGQGWK